MVVSAIVFDIGGVLAYDVWEHLLLDEAKGIAYTYKLDFKEVEKIGKQLWKKYAYDKVFWEKFASLPEIREKMYWQEFINSFKLQEAPETFIDMTNEFIIPVAGMNEIVEKLFHKGIRLGICSNNTDFWYKRQIEKCGYHEFFDDSKVILSFRLGLSKSSSTLEMFKAVANSLDVSYENCIFVDDRDYNIKQALNCGMVGILFPSEANYGAMYFNALLKKMGI